MSEMSDSSTEDTLSNLVEAGIVKPEDADFVRTHLDDPEVKASLAFMGALLAGQSTELVLNDEGRQEVIKVEQVGGGNSVMSIGSSDGKLSADTASFAATMVPIEDSIPEC